MSEKVIVAHDMGTSSDKAVLITVHGEIIGEAKQHYPVHHPKPGWAEQNPDNWWDAVCATTRQVLKDNKISPDHVAGITFASQTLGLVPVNKQGDPLRPAMIWLDSRSAEIVHHHLWKWPRVMGYHPLRLIRFLSITGGAPGHTGKDQIGKLLWLKKHEPDIYGQTEKFLDVKDFVVFRLTGNTTTSADLAFLWWMMDSRKQKNQWHPALCHMAGVDRKRLADIQPSAAIVGKVTHEAAKKTGLNPGTPVINGSGDFGASALGSGALEEGELIACLGTSGWIASHVTQRKIDVPHYAGCIGSALPEQFYLVLAFQETAGICLEWVKDHVLYHKDQIKKEFHVSKIYEILDQLAQNAAPGSEGLIFTPWMYGERCPLDDDTVRAGLINLGLNHSREHIVRAVLEGVALNMRWAMEVIENLYSPSTYLNLIGGGAQSDTWCQILADVTNREIRRVADPRHAGARGVALLASMSLGYMGSVLEMKKRIHVDKTFKPNPENRSLYNKRFSMFKDFYQANKKWYKRMNGGH